MILFAIVFAPAGDGAKGNVRRFVPVHLPHHRVARPVGRTTSHTVSTGPDRLPPFFRHRRRGMGSSGRQPVLCRPQST